MLNDTRIREAKPNDRDYKLSDFNGLYLLVRSTGGKLWRFAYRFGANGRFEMRRGRIRRVARDGSMR